MARARTRRGIIGIAFGGFAAQAVGRHPPLAAQEMCPDGCPEGQSCLNGACVVTCANDRDCRSKHDDPCMLNQCVDGVCVQAIVDCMPGYECCEGSCCPIGCTVDADCAVLDPCRWGRCGESGQCEFTDVDPCITCASDAECVDGVNTICCGGACQRPCPEGTVMGKGCECRADGSATLNGPVVRDDASGAGNDSGRQKSSHRVFDR